MATQQPINNNVGNNKGNKGEASSTQGKEEEQRCTMQNQQAMEREMTKVARGKQAAAEVMMRSNGAQCNSQTMTERGMAIHAKPF